jgi:hypothetical protein
MDSPVVSKAAWPCKRNVLGNFKVEPSWCFAALCTDCCLWSFIMAVILATRLNVMSVLNDLLDRYI